MAKAKRHYYLVDDLDSENGEIISRGLKAVTSISGVTINLNQGVIEVVSTINPDTHVRMACDVAGTAIRTKLKKKHLH